MRVGKQLAEVNIAAKCIERNWHTVTAFKNDVHDQFQPSFTMCQMSAKMPVACLKYLFLENRTIY